MYHIPNDKRTIRSATHIYAGLQACLKTKSFEEITITDIQKASGVSRSTFYRLFDNLSDVIYWTCDTYLARSFEAISEEDQHDELALTRHFVAFWMEQSEFFELMLQVRQPFILYQCLLQTSGKMRKDEKVPLCASSWTDDTEARYALNLHAGIIFSLLKTWLEGGRKESIDEVMIILEKQLDTFSKTRSSRTTLSDQIPPSKKVLHDHGES